MQTTKRAREHIIEISRFGGNQRLRLHGHYNDPAVQDCLRYGWVTWKRKSRQCGAVFDTHEIPSDELTRLMAMARTREAA
jgi:hypothetical protein